MAKKEWITAETVRKLQVKFFEICERDGKPPKVSSFIQELDQLKRNQNEEFVKLFNQGFEIPSKSWFDNKLHMPAWRKRWVDYHDNPPVEESLWNMGAPINREFTPGAIAKILELKSKTHWDNMTVREALWVSKTSSLPVGPEVLRMKATMFASAERLAMIAGETYYNSYELDAGIIETVYGTAIAATPLQPEEKKPVLKEQKTEERKAIQWDEWVANYEKNHVSEDIEMRNKLSKEMPDTLLNVLLIQKNSEDIKKPLTLAGALSYFRSKYQK